MRSCGTIPYTTPVIAIPYLVVQRQGCAVPIRRFHSGDCHVVRPLVTNGRTPRNDWLLAGTIPKSHLAS